MTPRPDPAAAGMIAGAVRRMRFTEDRTVPEIAAALGMTLHKVRRIVAELEAPAVRPDERWEPRLLPFDEDTVQPWEDDPYRFDALGNLTDEAPPDEILAELTGFFAEEEAA